MQINGFFLLGVAVGTLCAWLVDFGIHHTPGEGIVWGKALASVKGAVFAGATGTLLQNADSPAGDLSGALMLGWGVAFGMLGHWGGSTVNRANAQGGEE